MLGLVNNVRLRRFVNWSGRETAGFQEDWEGKSVPRTAAVVWVFFGRFGWVLWQVFERRHLRLSEAPRFYRLV